MKESRRYLPRSVIVVISTVVAISGVALAAHSMTQRLWWRVQR